MSVEMDRPGILSQASRGVRQFDDRNGLVFTQNEVAPIDVSWASRCKGYLDDRELSRKTESAVLSLHELAVRKIVQHRHVLEASDLRSIPWHYIRPVWKYLTDRQLLSLRLWKVFAVVFGASEEAPELNHHDVVAPLSLRAGSWSQMLVPLMSPLPTTHTSPERLPQSRSDTERRTVLSPALTSRVEFLTFLEITNVQVSRLDLLFLSDLYNLDHLSLGPLLQVHPSQNGIDDGILRSWISMSEEDPLSFRALRHLQLKEQPLITPASATYISRFPSLAWLDVEGDRPPKPFKTRLGECGWFRILNDCVNSKQKSSERPLTDEVESSTIRTQTLSGPHAATDATTDTTQLPILHFLIGAQGCAQSKYKQARKASSYSISFKRSSTLEAHLQDTVVPEMTTTSTSGRKRSRINEDHDSSHMLAKRQRAGVQMRPKIQNFKETLLQLNFR